MIKETNLLGTTSIKKNGKKDDSGQKGERGLGVNMRSCNEMACEEIPCNF